MTSPPSDLAPDVERRMTLRFLKAWRALAGDRPLAPLPALLTPAFAAFAAQRFVIALNAQRRPILAQSGAGLAPPAPETAAYSALSALPANCLIARAAAPWATVAERGAPTTHGGGYANAAGLETWFRAALVPATIDGATLDAVVGVATRRG